MPFLFRVRSSHAIRVTRVAEKQQEEAKALVYCADTLERFRQAACAATCSRP